MLLLPFPSADFAFVYQAGIGKCHCCLSQLLFFAVMSFGSVWQAEINTLIQSYHRLVMLMTAPTILPLVWLAALVSVADIQQLVFVRP